MERLSLEEALDWIRKSIEACIRAGYNMLHIDATVDILAGEGMCIKTVLSGTIDLIDSLRVLEERSGRRG